MVLRWYRSMDPRRFAGWQEQLQTLVAARPSSVVWGRHDPYIGTEYAQRFNARTVDVEDCGHWVPAEAPELVAQRIRELIAAG
jgi:pimeloyl-ACP methyl ester carboxylesterase